MNTNRLLLTLCAVFFIGVAAAASVLFYNASKEYEQLQQAEAASRRKLAEVQAKLAEQEKVLQRLRNDPEFVEKVIRQRLGWAKPGEFIWRYEN